MVRRSRLRLAAAALAGLAVLALPAASAGPALAEPGTFVARIAAPAAPTAPWRPVWTLTKAYNPPEIGMSAVTTSLTVRLWVRRGAPAVRSVRARVTSPAGTVTVVALALRAGTRRAGTWHARLRLEPQSPAGRWLVGYVARSVSGRTATDPATVRITVTKHAYPALAVSQAGQRPGTVVAGPGEAAVTITAFWPRRSTDADVTLSGPRRYLRLFAHMTRLAGDDQYALYQATVRLPRSAAPGTWRASVAIGDNGTWRSGPSGAFTVEQTATITLHVSTTRDRYVGGKITFTGVAGAYGRGGVWHPLRHARICLWWRTTQPGDQWACDHRFRAGWSGRFTDPEWPLHSARYKVKVTAAGLATGVSRVVFVRVVGG